MAGGFSKAVESIMSGKMLKNLGPGAMIGMGMNAYFGVSTYRESRGQGMGVIGSGAKAIGEMAVTDMIGMPAYLGLTAIETLPKAIVGGVNAINQQARAMTYASIGRNTPFANANFQDTQQAYTMRQAGMQLAKASKYNLQQTMLGNEAQFMRL
jgi:hypothetical protein